MSYRDPVTGRFSEEPAPAFPDAELTPELLETIIGRRSPEYTPGTHCPLSFKQEVGHA